MGSVLFSDFWTPHHPPPPSELWKNNFQNDHIQEDTQKCAKIVYCAKHWPARKMTVLFLQNVTKLLAGAAESFFGPNVDLG